MVEAIVRELELRKDYFHTQRSDNTHPSTINTVYFGGGTPSLLSREELKAILNAAQKSFYLGNVLEQTIECNPEDLSFEKLKTLKELGFNRLSIGIQTFQEPILQYINRAHTADQAKKSVTLAKELGFENITVDLIYALPGATAETLLMDIEETLRLEVPHISAYCFTVEEKTVFGKWQRQKKLHVQGDDFEREQYLLLTQTLARNGYEQYEISNFAKVGNYSQHNSAYWLGHHYLGIGPGAHSYDGKERQWNISNNSVYIESLSQNNLPSESEKLSNTNKINEALLTRLRTKWGVDLHQLKQDFDCDLAVLKANTIALLLEKNYIQLQENALLLTNEGKLLGDKIVAELMV